MCTAALFHARNLSTGKFWCSWGEGSCNQSLLFLYSLLHFGLLYLIYLFAYGVGVVIA